MTLAFDLIALTIGAALLGALLYALRAAWDLHRDPTELLDHYPEDLAPPGPWDRVLESLEKVPPSNLGSLALYGHPSTLDTFLAHRARPAQLEDLPMIPTRLLPPGEVVLLSRFPRAHYRVLDPLFDYQREDPETRKIPAQERGPSTRDQHPTP